MSNDNGLSRREFNKSLLAAGAAAVTAAMPTGVATAQAKRGGRLRVAAHVQSAQGSFGQGFQIVQVDEYAVDGL